MNKRILKKVYKRAERKLLAASKPYDNRSTLEIEQRERILSPLERKVFLREQALRGVLFEQVKAELIAEGKW